MQMKNNFCGAVLFGALALLGGTPAWSQEAPQCLCPSTIVRGTVGSVSPLSGNVMVSQSAGYVPAEQDSGLSVGSRVMTSNDSSANLTMRGGCQVALGANSTATVVTQRRQMCVIVDSQVAPGAGLLQSVGGPGLIVASGLGVGIALIIANDDDDNRCVSDC